MAVTYEPIATSTLGTSATQITFSSIPATYTDLRIVVTGKSSASASVYLRFNSDTGSNYSNTVMQAYVGNAGVFSYKLNNNSQLFVAGYSTGIEPNTVCLATADIFSYTSADYKSVLSTESYNFVTNGEVTRSAGVWRSTSAITAITIRGGTYDAGTRATLFGIKAA